MELLREMKEPLITTQAPAREHIHDKNTHDTISAVDPKQHYSAVIGWALDNDMIVLQNEQTGLESDAIYEAGGLHSLEEDRQIVALARGDILIYVKAWEPPTMDFIDFLSALSRKRGVSVTVYPLGTPERGLDASDAEFEIWKKKISLLKQENIRMIR